jgi:hypothetical protein
MKSKSPLNAYKYNMTGAYANPQTVIQPILGAEVAKSVIGAASKLGSQLITKEVDSKAAKQASASKNFSDMAKSGQEELNKIQHSKVGGENILGDFSSKGMIGAGKPEIGKFSFLTPGENPITLKGSPVKHNTGAAGAIGNADPLAGGIAGIGQRISNQAQQRAAKSQQSGSGIFGTIAQAASQGGSVVGSIGQQMGNQAQQRAAKLYTSRESNGPTAEAAGGMIGVTGSIGQDVLPPPNQVAETGSYGGGGDRILEMDSNPVGNQSIGRDTDVASQLFGSGQRASMLAMKGTPLHTEGHGGAKGHTHAKPGDDLDQTVAENMGVNDIENYRPIQRFKEKQIVVNPQSKDTIFSQGRDFVIPEQMKGIKRSSEGTPKYKPVYINRNKKQ